MKSHGATLNTILSEKSQSERLHAVRVLLYDIWKGKARETVKKISGCRG